MQRYRPRAQLHPSTGLSLPPSGHCRSPGPLTPSSHSLPLSPTTPPYPDSPPLSPPRSEYRSGERPGTATVRNSLLRLVTPASWRRAAHRTYEVRHLYSGCLGKGMLGVHRAAGLLCVPLPAAGFTRHSPSREQRASSAARVHAPLISRLALAGGSSRLVSRSAPPPPLPGGLARRPPSRRCSGGPRKERCPSGGSVAAGVPIRGGKAASAQVLCLVFCRRAFASRVR